MNRIVPEKRSRITNRNGRSTLIAGGAEMIPIPTLVGEVRVELTLPGKLETGKIEV
ncbi:MAG: hypothetical protein Q7S20_05045 [Gemmatimonadaceae bacterium]|nr:hypothetical protein [Gemmatimonadaceae bacterium]